MSTELGSPILEHLKPFQATLERVECKVDEHSRLRSGPTVRVSKDEARTAAPLRITGYRASSTPARHNLTPRPARPHRSTRNRAHPSALMERSKPQETPMPSFVRRLVLHYGIYRRYPLRPLPALRNAWRIART